ncbi:sensor histidine kinase [Novipirellula artificiosorum]|uniref:sensor histidine kinase n=1 Tax=Novipirellula artificiosorum TaxID=2528016 RepID=UPI001E414A21|nr:HAMP domain-containing sensor histidine kinase [Novipirellula artificiosorum]
MILCAVVAAGAVAAASYYLGAREANQEVDRRLAGIEQTLAASTFPLSGTVLRLIADMTQTELATFDVKGELQNSTLELSAEQIRAINNRATQTTSAVSVIESNQRRFRVCRFPTANASNRSDQVQTVVVFFSNHQLKSNRRRSMMLPLLTGLSTVLALTTVTLSMTGRLIRRLSALQRRVDRVAAGDFSSTLAGPGLAERKLDELGRLGEAVDTMADQLSQLWSKVHQQQSEQLLHQIAGGMAHQLRNSLTGARMAIELHAAECPDRDDEGLRIAIHQVEVSEDYVRRLLLAGSGRQDRDRPASVSTCWSDVQASLSPIARHLQIDVNWNLHPSTDSKHILDGSTWVAAVNNLVQNAMQAGDQVDVDATLIDDRCIRVSVQDNGAGIPKEIEEDVFKPFVTSKPEGMGLGLPLVDRAAARLGGQVCWSRQDGRTRFEFDAIAIDAEEAHVKEKHDKPRR